MNNNIKLTDINVDKFTEKKNGFTYLSWAHAWKAVLEYEPDATYEVKKNPETGMPYFKDDAGCMVYTSMTVRGITREMWLPIMGFRNESLKNPDTFIINKSVMRCLTKNIAMFGLGLNIYAEEDFPEEGDSERIVEPKVPSKKFLDNLASITDVDTLRDMYAKTKDKMEKEYIMQHVNKVKETK